MLSFLLRWRVLFQLLPQYFCILRGVWCLRVQTASNCEKRILGMPWEYDRFRAWCQCIRTPPTPFSDRIEVFICTRTCNHVISWLEEPSMPENIYSRKLMQVHETLYLQLYYIHFLCCWSLPDIPISHNYTLYHIYDFFWYVKSVRHNFCSKSLLF